MIALVCCRYIIGKIRLIISNNHIIITTTVIDILIGQESVDKFTAFKGSQGPPDDVTCFLQLWCMLHHPMKFGHVMHEFTYALSPLSLRAPTKLSFTPGKMRAAQLDDMGVLVPMMHAFGQEVKVPGASDLTNQFYRELLTRSVNEGCCFVWEKDQELVISLSTPTHTPTIFCIPCSFLH